MSLVLSFRCVICTLHYRDLTIDVDRNQAENHIYSDHDYTEKLNAARFVGLVSENEKRGASWLAHHLAELSFLKENN